jgi:hypothetical protein
VTTGRFDFVSSGSFLAERPVPQRRAALGTDHVHRPQVTARHGGARLCRRHHGGDVEQLIVTTAGAAPNVRSHFSQRVPAIY